MNRSDILLSLPGSPSKLLRSSKFFFLGTIANILWNRFILYLQSYQINDSFIFVKYKNVFGLEGKCLNYIEEVVRTFETHFRHIQGHTDCLNSL